ncbi:MAG: glycine--tRNA ligase subunit beta [Firmicutes bacterium]|nr:glycine--tRNA ligase subunit beta [Bacillota bacterium]
MSGETRDFLLELGLEEVPARFLPSSIQQLEDLSQKALAGAGLHYGEAHVYATPRRLALLVSDLAVKAEDVETEVKGPSVAAAYDGDGQPTKALLGFCKGHGLEPKDVRQKELSGNLYIFATKKTLGKDTAEMLPDLIYGLINKLYFPKPMRWGYEKMRFVRPIRWLVALFGNQIVPVKLAGVQAGNVSRGHRLLGSDHIVIEEPAQYLDKLAENYVICDQERRYTMIQEQIAEVARSLDGEAAENPELLEEVVYLVEYPTALSGGFDEKYLSIPEELIITPMREHQRYFPVYKRDGSLAPKFITVRNGDGRYLDVVAAGNEKVLRARLADAEFFYTEDLKDNMEDRVEGLRNVVFHEKLGSMREKVARIGKLALYLGERLDFTPEEMKQTGRVAYLAKSDLGSRVVYEFPELQGIIGEDYALAAGEEDVVAQAIREHYLPRFAGDDLPESKPGIAVALADKMDSLAGFFAVGMIPTGSQDPYALRRAATGCAQIILKKGLHLDLQEIMQYALHLFKQDVPELASAQDEEITGALLGFFKQRLDNIMDEEGLSYDIVNAVSALPDTDLYTILRKANALYHHRQGQGFASLLAGFTRAANLLRSAREKGYIGEEQVLQVREDLFRDDSEKDLWREQKRVAEKVHAALAKADYESALDAVGGLTDAINRFFDAVMVMDKEEAVRDNRLALLSQITALTKDIGDLSKIVENKTNDNN